MVSRALNLYDDPNTPLRPPLSDIEFRAFLDAVGQINNMAKLREVIYCGGIEPSLRLTVNLNTDEVNKIISLLIADFISSYKIIYQFFFLYFFCITGKLYGSIF